MYYDSGAFFSDLARRVAFQTESLNPEQAASLLAYLAQELSPAMARLGFSARIVDNPQSGFGPLLIAHRIEADELPTVLLYGHGDVGRCYDAQWHSGFNPWRLVADGERLYGRGTADSKGQHTINLAALEQVLVVRDGRLGFNVKVIIEMGEETGSPGLHDICTTLHDELAADLLIASDGPRVRAEQPTVFLGSRGLVDFDLIVRCRDGAHHSGNWGGLLRNPATVLASAISSLVDGQGRILVEGLQPPAIPAAVLQALTDIVVGGGVNDPDIDADWGEPGLTPTQRVFAWNALEVLTFKAGNPDNPVGAIPPFAQARCQLRFVVGTNWQNLQQIVRDHLDAHGFPMVEVSVGNSMSATRLDSENPWVIWALESLAQTTGKKPVLLPNIGASVPNDVFAELLGLPTLWIPHSYPACSQHAPNEHLLAPVAREALQIMAGLFWDLGEVDIGLIRQRNK